MNRCDVAALTAGPALRSNAEVERSALAGGLIGEDVVCPGLDLAGAVLPYRRIVQGVVCNLHGEMRVSRHKADNGQNADRDRGVCRHRLTQGDRCPGDLLREGHGMGGGGLPVIGGDGKIGKSRGIIPL